MEIRNCWSVQAIVQMGGVSRQVPTFYLDGNVQGFQTAEGAERVAREILNPMGDPDLKVHPYCVRV